MAQGVNLGGGVCHLIAAAIVALKIAVIIQLIQFAITVKAAITASVGTFGGSLAAIPIARLAASKAIEFAISVAIDKVMGG